MNKWNTQMSAWELESLEVLLKEWYSIPKAALALWRNKTTIYRLFQNNCILYNQTKYKYIWWMIWKTWKLPEDNLEKIWKKKIYFNSKSVYNKRTKRKSIASKRYCRIESWSKLEKYILDNIKQYLSPEQISWRWRLECSEALSKDTIYSYIYNTHPELIKKFFRRKGKKYQHKRKEKYLIQQRRSIHKRPKSIEKRSTLGHWESDTVVGKRKTLTKKVILTHVERKSGFLIARVLQSSHSQNVVKATLEDFLWLPKYKRKSMTFDNGREFAHHYDIERESNITIYFADAYKSRQRWTNENTNWLLRQFLPKWSDFELLEEKELQKYVTLINNRPRERLGFLTPYEVFNNKTKVAFDFRF